MWRTAARQISTRLQRVEIACLRIHCTWGETIDIRAEDVSEIEAALTLSCCSEKKAMRKLKPDGK